MTFEKRFENFLKAKHMTSSMKVDPSYVIFQPSVVRIYEFDLLDDNFFIERLFTVCSK